MRKTLVSIVLAFLSVWLFSQTAFAGGIDNKQNFSTRYLGTGSRNAATDSADLAAYNPAGTVMQDAAGFAISVDVHYIFKDYEHKYTNANPAGPVTGDQDEPSIVPGLFGTYNAGNWGVFGSVTINGGGGEVDFKNGNTITNDVEWSLMNSYGAAGITSNESIRAESHYITYTLGSSYKFNDMFSIAAGIRYVDATKEVDAFANSAGVGDLIAKYEEEADNWGWVAGFNVKPSDAWLLALRYESRVDLEFETDVSNSTNALGAAILGSMGKTDGGKSDRDLPALLGLGVSWDATDKLNVNSSLTYYFEEDADWDGQEDNVDNSYDFGISATYSFMDNLRVSVGYMYTNVGIDADDFGLVEKMSPVLDAHSFFCGLGYDFSDFITVNLGVMINSYEDDTGTDVVGNPVTYDKQNNSVAMGVVFRF